MVRARSGSGNDGGQSSGSESPPAIPVEALSTGRSRRATAGNRMRELLEQERERMQAEADETVGTATSRSNNRAGKASVEDDENDEDAMFRDDVGEGYEDVDFEERDDVEDIVDSDFDMSSDQGDDEDDEEAGERALQEEEKAAKKASRAAQKARVIGASTAAASSRKPTWSAAQRTDAASTAARKAAKRITFASNTTDGQAENSAAAERQRASKRKSTMRVAETVQARIKQDEERRARFVEQAAPKRKKVARLSQADLIAEALEMEERNRESLKRFFEREEERKQRDRRDKQTAIQGPFLRWRSVMVDRTNGEQRHIVQVQDEKSGRSKAVQAITLDPVFAAREAAAKARQARQEALLHKQQQEQDLLAKGQTDDLTADVTADVTEDATADATANATAVATVDITANEVGETSSAVHSRQTTASDGVIPTGGDDEITTPSTTLNSTQQKETSTDQSQDDIKMQKRNSIATSLKEPFEHPLVQETGAESKELNESSIMQQNDAEGKDATTLAEETSTPSWEARAYISLHDLPPSTPWPTLFGHVLGTHADWSCYPVVPARNRPLRPRQSVCPVTGLPARYRDPRSGIPFANVEAYGLITRVMQGDYRWSGKGAQGASNASSEPALDKTSMPWTSSTGLRGSARATQPARQAPAQRYDPLEMGCFFDLIDEPGANHVNLRAASSPTSGSSGMVANATSGYIVRGAIAPGDEKAVMAAAQALPAGSTRSGGRRSTAG